MTPDTLRRHLHQTVTIQSPLFGRVTGTLVGYSKGKAVIQSHSVLQAEVSVPMEWVLGPAEQMDVMDLEETLEMRG